MTSGSPTRLIGVDWATQDCNQGVAVFDCLGDRLTRVQLTACGKRQRALDVVAAALTATYPAILAIDAPLGWPAALSAELSAHTAGEGLQATADDMFSRATDHFVFRELHKRPLEVGANFIARTAHSANQFLAALREKISRPIPLLWSPHELGDAGVIEVYPGATNITDPNALASLLGIDDVSTACATEHVRDAAWCVVAALQFLRGECHRPTAAETARREGWIWFRRT